jgi:hypothetical protein
MDLEPLMPVRIIGGPVSVGGTTRCAAGPRGERRRASQPDEDVDTQHVGRAGVAFEPHADQADDGDPTAMWKSTSLAPLLRRSARELGP